MARSNSYHMLIGSLPALPSHFEHAERVPISKLRLEERLRMLRPEDARVVAHLGDFLLWDRQPLDRTDDQMRRHYERFMDDVRHDLSRSLMEQAMTVRILVGALRQRRLGREPPPFLGRWRRPVVDNWKRPDLGLGAVFPWLAEVNAHLNEDPPARLKRTLLNIAWAWSKRQAGEYDFSFEAVVLYLFRWEITYRWTCRNAEAGRERFERLVDDAMANYANMF